MSLNYAASLSKYPDKGVLGKEELIDSSAKVKQKVLLLAEAIRRAQKIVFITGAGISTSSGIPDFRGPNGVWTLEEKGLQPTINVDFELAKPTFTHFALNSILKSGKSCYVISQNVDNLHLKSGFPRENLSELHGNIFTERCLSCGKEYLRGTPTKTIGLKKTGRLCTTLKSNNRPCRGKLVDSVLDWEDSLPWDELAESEYQCSMADLCLILGTSLQIQPVGNMPFKTKRYGGEIMIVNLQRTRMDQHADLVIHEKCDKVFKLLCSELRIEVEENVVTLPCSNELRVIKEAYRCDPPPIVKYKVKRIKVCTEDDISSVKIKTENEYNDTNGSSGKGTIKTVNTVNTALKLE